jgi:CBS domain-containing protein
MRAKSIINTKGGAVITTHPDTIVEVALSTMVQEKIGALLVRDGNDDIVGIVTERDVLHGLVEHGSALLGLQVADLMTRNVHTASLEDDVGTLMTVMTEHRCRHIPVMEEGALVGLISIGDLVKYRLKEMEQESSQLRDYITQ